jgi:acetyl-CoA synthetase
MSNIETVLSESRIFPANSEFAKRANIRSEQQYQNMCEQSQQDYEGYWGDLARQYIAWHKPFMNILNQDNPPFYKWFEDGKLNVSYNCLDRHLLTQPNKTAIIFESDSGHVDTVSYKELYHKVCRFANGLKALGVNKGDRVIIYLPNSIEAIVAMQACARIGAIHSVVFGGFSAKSIHERIHDAQAKIVITADAQKRGGKIFPLKNDVNQALAIPGCESVEKVIVHKRTGEEHNWVANRDIWWHEVIRDQADNCEPEWVEAEHPLFILYTSGSTGTPKGVQHSSAGYLLGAITTMRWVFDIKPSDIFWSTADVGWITGHTYLCYGPLAVGTTQIVFEGVPTYPYANRFWRMIEEHKVTIFYTAPTAIRALIKAGGDLPKQHDLTSLRLLGTVGEPINPEAWMWYYNEIGGGKCPIVDTWWQTETGSHILAPIPGITPLVPGSCTRPMPGLQVDIVDENGNSITDYSGGYLVIKQPFPSQIRTIWGNPQRFIQAYYPQDIANGKYYVAGDSAHRDQYGYYHILGRIDDVLNVSGHRLGTMEIESALVANPLVAEAAVVGKPHDIKGEAIIAFVVLKNSIPQGEDKARLIAMLREWVGKEIGNLAKPDEIRFGENLPKTRSGKIMRRILRSLAKGETITQDISTLENPAILEQLKA